MRGLSFQWPLLLPALLVVPAVIAAGVLVDRRRARYPVAFTNLGVLASVVEEQRSRRRWVPIALFALALTFAAGALARPQTTLSVPEENATVVLVVDVSGSMRANDVEPTRLDAALAAMRTFLDRLPSRFKVGLVSFTTEAEVLSEPTRDRDVIRESLSYLQPEAGTAIGDGLQAGIQLARRTLDQDGVVRQPGEPFPGAIVLLSDGAQNRGRLQPLKAAANAQAAGIRVNTVALGTPEGVVTFGFGRYANAIPVPPDPATMRAIARETSGETFSAETASKLSNVYRSLGSSIGRRSELREITSWFAAASALLLVAAFGAGRLVEGRLP